MDLRICRICEKQFDIDSLPGNIRVVDTDDSHFTFLELRGFGPAHVLMTRAQSAEKIEPADEVKYEVRQPEPKVVPEQPTDILEELFEETEPTAEQHQGAVIVVDPHSEPYVEPDLTVAESDIEIVEAIVQNDYITTYGNGTAKVEPEFRRPHKWMLHVDRKNVVTYGELRPGVRIRCVVSDPTPGFSMYEATQIEIFQEN